ncbi:hypothetical protein BLA29_014477 [Euroglyphus maynei]|uniref:Uncharacterized protein n=1 Tax=Euroglyphus maynei TaxID=6958 RepID=A0A1Y3BLN5_EURMA|nr:hypothetical protein BLA29_014477 [Euroglyphus maynei]
MRLTFGHGLYSMTMKSCYMLQPLKGIHQLLVIIKQEIVMLKNHSRQIFVISHHRPIVMKNSIYYRIFDYH